MDNRIFHGEVTPRLFSDALIAQFNRGSWRAQQFGSGDKIAVQVATRERPPSGGQTAVTITLEKVADGVSIQVGKQAWLGVAASLGISALTTWRNPWNILNRLDDIAQDIENLQLSEQIWEVLEATAYAAGASFELSERLRRLVCEYCLTANPLGEPSCIACGAPLGNVQPSTCRFCGFVLKPREVVCPNCQREL